MSLKPKWVTGIKDEDEQKELLADFLAAENLRKRLIFLLEEDVNSSLKRMRGFVKGGQPNLTESYASELAKQQTLLDIINLLR